LDVAAGGVERTGWAAVADRVISGGGGAGLAGVSR
jgi:hypothetical protein